jgi:sterol desaturase/sphingolipid hydroxylase (fatty acid hydroxylase superfamily)
MLGSSVYGCAKTWYLLIFLTLTSYYYPSPSLALQSYFSDYYSVCSALSSFICSHVPYITLSPSSLTFTISLLIPLEAVFVILNTVLAVCYKFDLFKSYKLHDEFPQWSIIKECLIDVTIGHVIVRPIMLYFSYNLFVYFGMSSVPEDMPRLSAVYLQLFACMCIDDTLFYFSHRALHHASVYKHIHKQHHTFKYTIGIATEYCHPVEDFLSNTLSTVAGPLLMGLHLSVTLTYLTFKLWQSIDAHSGYNFPFPVSPFSYITTMDCAPAHDYHHSHNKGNYGGFFIFWDWVFGTDESYGKFLDKQVGVKAYENVVVGDRKKGKVA